MQFNSTANLTPLTRQEALRLWMNRNGKSFSAWGGNMGVTGNAVSKLCDQDTMPVHRHEQLRHLGVPAELLPKPMDLKPGPKPRGIHGEFMAAFRGA